MKWRRWLGWGGLGLAVLVLVGLGLRPQPLLVDVQAVARGPLTVTIEEEGKTRVLDRYRISAPVSGFLRRIDLEVGATLAPGQKLTELEPLRSDVLDPRRRAEAQARIEAAEAVLAGAQAQVAAAQADAEFASSEYQRMRKLKETGAVSAQVLAQANNEKRRAEAVLRSAQFSVNVAHYERDAAATTLKYSAAEAPGSVPERVVITSPVAGAVLALHRQSEGVVMAGEPLLEVGDPRALEVAVDVLSFDAVRIKPGMAVRLLRWGGEPLEAVVNLVEPVGFTQVSALGVEEQRVWVIVNITSPLEQWLALGDGYRIEASFQLWQESSVLQVANAALFRSGTKGGETSGDRWSVFVAVDGVARLRSVTIGQRNGISAQVLEGLAEGEWVIVHPDASIQDGTAITPQS